MSMFLCIRLRIPKASDSSKMQGQQCPDELQGNSSGYAKLHSPTGTAENKEINIKIKI